MNKDSLENLLDLLPSKKLPANRRGVNLTDSYMKAKDHHRPLKDVLSSDLKGWNHSQDELAIMHAYNNSNILSVKAPWSDRKRPHSAHASSSSSSYPGGMTNNSAFSLTENSDKQQLVENSMEKEKEKEKEKDYFADYLNDLDSTDSGSNVYSYGKLIIEESKPKVSSYWPNNKIKLTTMAWVDSHKTPKSNKKIVRWL